jgi:hypothetical protein
MEDGMTTTSTLSRRSMMTAVATIAAAAAVPALAEQLPIQATSLPEVAVDGFDRAGMGLRDSIFAAIEAHRRAWSDLEPCSELDEAASGGDKEAEQELSRLHAALSEAEEGLLDIPPTTIAGAAAVLEYAVYHVSGGGGESWPNGEAWMSKHGVKWEVIFHRNLAKALQAMTVQS